MKICTEHPTSTFGFPVILDDDGRLMDYQEGIKQLRARLGLTARELAEKCGVEERTVNGWEGGRMPSAAALNALAHLIKKHRWPSGLPKSAWKDASS